MVDRGPLRTEEPGGLSTARADFAASLSRRVSSIRAAVALLGQEPSSANARENLLRRLHALSASARVLGFAAAAELVAGCEHRLRTGAVETLSEDLTWIGEHLEGLSALVLRGSYSMAPGISRVVHEPTPVVSVGLCVLLGAGPMLDAALRALAADSKGIEIIEGLDADRLRDLAASHGPDVILLDGAQGFTADLIRALCRTAETSGSAVFVANAPTGELASLRDAGARAVFPVGTPEGQIWRALLSVQQTVPELVTMPEPLGDVSLPILADRLAQELRRGLLEGIQAEQLSATVALGEGTEAMAAIWAAVAKIRDLVSPHLGEGAANPSGTVGVVPLALGGARRRAPQPSAPLMVDLLGRRVLVADDDPAVAWFVGGTLRAVGAEVDEVHDGQHALSVAIRRWPQVVLTDVLMPGMDGFALCRELKRDAILCDVPVILLSWKEDLLFRLRELGADADAYLRKEAKASTIVDRVRELLAPRAALERRLMGPGEVRGRLDGTTTRLLLELTCRFKPHAHVVLRDAAALYDVRVREGTLWSVTRTAADGSTRVGSDALLTMLGVSAGRFSVVEDDQVAATVQGQFSGTFEQVVAPVVARVRAAQRVLGGASLSEVEQLDLDLAVFTGGMPRLPPSLHPIVDELCQGTSPRDLLNRAGISVRLLEALLTDAARRGCVRAIRGPKGEDLLAQEMAVLSLSWSSPPPTADEKKPATVCEPTQTSASLPAMDQADPPETPSPAPAALPLSLPVAGRSSPKSLTPDTDDIDWALEADFGPPVSRSVTPVVPPAAPLIGAGRPKLEMTWGQESRTQPGVGRKRSDPPIQGIREQNEDHGISEAVSSSGAAAEGIERALIDSTRPEAAESSERETHDAGPVRPLPADGPPPKAAEAVEPPETHPVARIGQVSPLPTVEPSPTRGALSVQTDRLDKLPDASQELADGIERALVDSTRPATGESAADPPITPAGVTVPRRGSDPKPRRPIEPLILHRRPDTTSIGPIVQPAVPSEPKPRKNAEPAKVTVANPQAPAQPSAARAVAGTPPIGAVEKTQGPIASAGLDLSDDEIVFPLVSSLSPPMAAPVVLVPPLDLVLSGFPGEGPSAASVSSGTPGAEPHGLPFPIESQPIEPSQGETTRTPPTESRSRSAGYWRALGVVSLTAVSSFLLATPVFRWIKGSASPSPSASSVPSSTGTANASVVGGMPSSLDSASTALPQASVSLRPIPVPEGMVVVPGKAMLEVVTGAGHAIFIDDRFVGRGPVRLVPLDPGSHTVRTRINDQERVDTIQLSEGQVARLPLDEAWK